MRPKDSVYEHLCKHHKLTQPQFVH